MKPKISLFLLVLVALMPGCMHRVYVSSNTYADREELPHGFPLGSTFTIKAKASPSHNEMLSKEIKHKISNTLQELEYTVIKEGTPDYYLSFSYDMTAKTELVQVPVYVPGPSQTTLGTVHTHNGYQGGAVQYQETTQTSGTWTYVDEERTTFTRSLSMQVNTKNPFTQAKESNQVWQGSAVSCGDTGDLREIVDYLMKSIFKNFGLNTNRVVEDSHKG